MTTPPPCNLCSTSNTTTAVKLDNIIKALIVKSKTEILNGFKQEIKTLKETISVLHERVNQLEATNALLASRCQNLEQKYSNESFDFDYLCREAEERQKTRKFVVISGLP